MYGNLDYQIMQEIARIAQRRGDTMDPTLNSLAHKLQQEEAARHLTDMSERGTPLVHRLGGLLVAIGQKMQADGLETQDTSEACGFPNEVCA